MKLNYDLVYDLLKFCEAEFPTPVFCFSERDDVHLYAKKGKETTEKARYLSNQENLKKYSWNELAYHVQVLNEDGFFKGGWSGYDKYDYLNYSALSMKGHEFIAVYEGRDVPRQYFLK